MNIERRFENDPYTLPINRFAAELFNDWPFRALYANRASEPNGTWTPAVDVLTREGDLVLQAVLPGLTEEDVDLSVDGNVLTLKGVRKLEDDSNKHTYHRLESRYGEFSRSFTIPETVDRDRISAEFKHGILTVTIPQKPEAKPRTIRVNVK